MKQRNVQQRRARRSRECGGTLVMVIVFTVALCGFAALSVGVGNVLVHRTRLQEAGDSAAIASVVDWALGATAATVGQRARSFASANGVPANAVKTVRVGKWVQSTRTFTEQATFTSSEVPAVEVTNQRTVSLFFGKVVGMSAMSPRTVSVAVVAPATGVGQALPWAACNNPANPVPAKCDIINLKNGNDCTTAGNFGALDFDGSSGAAGYRTSIINGYNGVLHVGDFVNTKPGNMVGPTTQGLNDRLQGLPAYVCTPTSAPPDNKRLAIIPVTTDFTCPGASCQVQILGFWTVALIQSPGGGDVVAQFIEVFNGTEVNPNAPPIVGELNGIALVK